NGAADHVGLRLEREATEPAARRGLLTGPAQRVTQGRGVGRKRAFHFERGPVADVAVECELERRAGETDLDAGSVALQRGNEVGETDRGVDRLGMSCHAKRPVAAKLGEIDGQASAISTFASVSTISYASSRRMIVPSAIRISENDAGRSGPGLRFRASVSMWPDQFELWSALKMIAMVGRTSETSAISMRPAKKGKKCRRATTCSAVSAGAPVRLSPSITSSKLTAPLGNSDTEVPPRSTGSSPVTARISALTASRTTSADIRNGKIT